jgi:hypothetical protein
MSKYPRFDSDEFQDQDDRFSSYSSEDLDSLNNGEENLRRNKESCTDDLFTRRLRPASVVMMLIFFVFIVLADGNLGNFHINTGFFPIIETVLATMIVAYFGSRGIEKSFRSWERGQYHSSYRSSSRSSYGRRPRIPPRMGADEEGE